MTTDIVTPALHLFRAKPRRPVQEWCDANLRLNERVAYQAGPWRTSAFPHQRGIFWLWAHPKVEELYLQWGTRLGKTVLIPALLAWAADNDPGPGMIATPNATSARMFEREKMYPMLEDCRTTAALLLPEHKRAFPVVDLRHMLVYMAWSGSATALGEKSVRYLFLTELDKHASDASTEADAETLAMERTKDWPNHKILKESTPTIEGLSRIAKNLASADVVLYYHVPCPHCREFQVLGFTQVKWAKEGEHSTPELARKTAYYECERCREAIRDQHRARMLAAGVWAPRDHEIPRGCRSLVLWGPGGPRHRVGTHLSSLYSPTLNWGEMAQAFLLYRKDPRKLQDWLNGWEAKTFSIVQDRPEWTKVRDRLAGTEARGRVPTWASWLTAGADCHGWRKGNFYVVRAWGPGGRSHLVEEGNVSLPGESEAAQIAAVAQAMLGRGFEKEGGGTMNVALACIDSGYATADVYAECLRWGPTRLRPMKGSDTADSEWWASPIQTDPRTGKRYPHGFHLFRYNAAQGASWVNSRLFMDADAPDAWTLHQGPSEEYLRSLCNVVPVPEKDTRGRERIKYRVVEEEWGDHYHDCEIYAQLGALMLGIRNAPARPAPPRRKVEPVDRPKKINIRRRPGGFFRRG